MGIVDIWADVHDPFFIGPTWQTAALVVCTSFSAAPAMVRNVAGAFYVPKTST